MASSSSTPLPRTVAVIGAGLTGLVAARALHDHGFAVTVFEKSRGLGGRLATRRTHEGHAFDHGAQYITARGDAFSAFLADAVANGSGSIWRPRGSSFGAVDAKEHFVGAPAMNALVKPLGADLPVRLQHRVVQIMRARSGWSLTLDGADTPSVFDDVICTAPAPQTRELLAWDSALAEQLASVDIAPCWALMLSFDHAFDPGADVFRSETAAISWIARNSSKQGRPDSPECWIAHASPEWSRQNLERAADDVAGELTALFHERLRSSVPTPSYSVAHRWRYAMTTAPLGTPSLCTEDQSLFIGGDWCLGARVEAAFDSGTAIAQAMIAR